MREMRNIFVIAGAGLLGLAIPFLVSVVINILPDHSSILPYTTVEAQSPKRFQLQATEDLGGMSLSVVCDTATGTLVYRTYHNGNSAAIAAVPNGCQKNPR